MKSCCQSYVNIWTPYQNHQSKNEACWQTKVYFWLTVCLFTTCKIMAHVRHCSLRSYSISFYIMKTFQLICPCTWSFMHHDGETWVILTLEMSYYFRSHIFLYDPSHSIMINELLNWFFYDTRPLLICFQINTKRSWQYLIYDIEIQLYSLHWMFYSFYSNVFEIKKMRFVVLSYLLPNG